MSTPVSWRTLLALATERLVGAGGSSPHDDARRILEQASGLDAAELVTSLDAPATRRAAGAVEGMVARRAAGEPLQYVLGSWGFRSLDLHLDVRVLIPRPETEVVVDVALDVLERRDGGEERPRSPRGRPRHRLGGDRPLPGRGAW